MKPNNFVLWGLASAIKLDSCLIIAIETEIGIFQRSSVFLAALYQEYLSLKILQTSVVVEGGALEAQLTKTQKQVNKANLLIMFI
jgi:hypothetical protein